jgi:hypothetical protein
VLRDSRHVLVKELQQGCIPRRGRYGRHGRNERDFGRRRQSGCNGRGRDGGGRAVGAGLLSRSQRNREADHEHVDVLRHVLRDCPDRDVAKQYVLAGEDEGQRATLAPSRAGRLGLPLR